MGMQCHFSLKDLPESIEVTKLHDVDSDTYRYEFGYYSVSGTADSPDVWFDIGHQGRQSMNLLSYLITQRVCFQCS